MAEAQHFDKEKNGSAAKAEGSSRRKAMTPSCAASEKRRKLVQQDGADSATCKRRELLSLVLLSRQAISRDTTQSWLQQEVPFARRGNVMPSQQNKLLIWLPNGMRIS